MVKGFKDGEGLFHPIKNSKGVRSSRDTSGKSQGLVMHSGIRKKRMQNKVELVNLTMRELQDNPMFEEDKKWLDVFAETPEVIVPDERRGLFHIWFGGASHTVHQYTPDGQEVDVFTFGFEKDRLEKKEVLKMIQRRLNERDDE